LQVDESPARLSELEKKLLHALQIMTVAEELRWRRAMAALEKKRLNSGTRKKENGK